MRPDRLLVMLCLTSGLQTFSIGAFPALLPEIGRSAALPDWQLGAVAGAFGFARMLTDLPTQFNEATTRTIELIDVLWLSGNSIVAAFEVECNRTFGNFSRIPARAATWSSCMWVMNKWRSKS